MTKSSLRSMTSDHWSIRDTLVHIVSFFIVGRNCCCIPLKLKDRWQFLKITFGRMNCRTLLVIFGKRLLMFEEVAHLKCWWVDYNHPITGYMHAEEKNHLSQFVSTKRTEYWRHLTIILWFSNFDECDISKEDMIIARDTAYLSQTNREKMINRKH